MNDCYDLVIIGTTFSGLGAAFSNDKRILVVDRRSDVGYEFINCFNSGINWNETVLSDESLNLKNELISREIITNDGFVHLPAIAPVLYNKIKNAAFDVLLLTEIVSVNKKDDMFEVEMYNAAGFASVKTYKILDTVCNRMIGNTCKPKIISKFVNAQLHNYDDDFSLPLAWDKNISFHRGKFTKEITLKLEIDSDDDWVTARHKLNRIWLKRPEKMKSFTIASVADYFETVKDKSCFKVEDSWNILISDTHLNPLEAFEAGVNFGRALI